MASDGLLDRLRLASTFLADVSTPPDAAALLYYRGVREVAVCLIGERLSVGRDGECGLSFPTQWEMSRRHFEIAHTGSRYVLRDLYSLNGTTIAGLRGRIRTRDLCNGDLVDAGGVTFLFVRPD